MRFFESLGGRLCLLALAFFLIGGGLGTMMENGLRIWAISAVISQVLIVFGVTFSIGVDEMKTSWVVMVSPWIIWLLLMVFFHFIAIGQVSASWAFVLGGLSLLFAVRYPAKADAEPPAAQAAH